MTVRYGKTATSKRHHSDNPPIAARSTSIQRRLASVPVTTTVAGHACAWRVSIDAVSQSMHSGRPIGRQPSAARRRAERHTWQLDRVRLTADKIEDDSDIHW
jgi:hypothetical protein